MARSIVTLTTDFGLSEPYAGIMKGVILNINPEATVVDLSNDIKPFDILEGALAIAHSYRYFPPRTIHVVVVDPGVGSARRPLLAAAGGHYFVAPDNGVLSLVFAREEDALVRHITSSHYFLEPLSQTFHGRDIFAPVAAWLSRNVETEKFGEPCADFVRFTMPEPKRINERLIKGVVLRVDRFGSLMTNITPANLPELFTETPPPFKIMVGKTEITSLKSAYSHGAPGEIFAILGSSGHLELAASRGSASHTLGVGKGAEVGVVWG
jgi:S-adenosyl-L-methionine hydrolase (adenosine-forming)